jgi:hypothetical protein
MASAWGSSWGSAWGAAWGAIASAATRGGAPQRARKRYVAFIGTKLQEFRTEREAWEAIERWKASKAAPEPLQPAPQPIQSIPLEAIKELAVAKEHTQEFTKCVQEGAFERLLRLWEKWKQEEEEEEEAILLLLLA